MNFPSMFYEITAILLIAALFAVLGIKLRQPLIVSFLAAGIAVGPSGIGLVTGYEQIQLFAQMGIALLLFVVGLKLDMKMIKTMGPVALAVGLGQVIFTSIFGYLIAAGLQFSVVESIYIAVALTFSSTIIIVKLLSDNREIDSLHGRIAIGLLIVQDIVVVLVMIGLTALGDPGPANRGTPLQDFLFTAIKGALFLGGIAVLMRYGLPALLEYLARSAELLVLFAVAWAVLLATVGDMLGFSKEVGAFLGGVSLASTPYRESIGSRLVGLRDFLLLFFFIDLGSRLELSRLDDQVGNAVIFSLFVLIGKPLVVMVIMGAMGYRKRTGLLAGLTVAQISEFSLILGALGLSLGHIQMEAMGLITLVGLVTICLSTYMILYSGLLYEKLAPFLSAFERKTPYREKKYADSDLTGSPVDIILFGLGRYGGSIARYLLLRGKKVVGVDFDPQVLDTWRRKGLSTLYGDAGDPEIYEHLPVPQARWVVSAIPFREITDQLLSSLKERKYPGKIAVTAASEREADEFQSAGAHVVLRPFIDAAEHAVDSLTEAMHLISDQIDWPVAIKEIRLGPGSVHSGKRLRQIPLRLETGASILAVSRAGKTFFDPEPDFRLYPGDRMVVLGAAENLKRAAEYLEKKDLAEDPEAADKFALAEVGVAPDSAMLGQTLADLSFRVRYGVTVIGIRRNGHYITSVAAGEKLQAGDRLFIAGNNKNVENVKKLGQL